MKLQHANLRHPISLFKVKSSLGPLETEAMNIVWKQKTCSVRDVVNALPHDQARAYTTIMTVMDHLYQKGFVSREKVKKSYIYVPVAKEEPLTMLSLKKIFSDLSVRYGKGLAIQTVLGVSIPGFPTVPFTTRAPAPVWYGMGLTLAIALLGFSAVDLLKNLHSLGTLDYFTLIASEPTLIKEHLMLSLPAIIESIPIINALTTVISLASAILLVRKLMKLFDRSATSPRLVGGASSE